MCWQMSVCPCDFKLPGPAIESSLTSDNARNEDTRHTQRFDQQKSKTETHKEGIQVRNPSFARFCNMKKNLSMDVQDVLGQLRDCLGQDHPVRLHRIQRIA